MVAGMAIMTAAQITRGVAFRRYAYSKPIKQIADEAGLGYEQVLAVLKGEPFNVQVAARLTGYLRTPCSNKHGYRPRWKDDVLSATRYKLMRRLARLKVLARTLDMPLGRAKEDKLSSFTDDKLRAYIYNAEDAVKENILKLYPTIAKLFKFSDDMAPWEYIERIDALKNSSEAQDALARYHRSLQKKIVPAGVCAT